MFNIAGVISEFSAYPVVNPEDCVVVVIYTAEWRLAFIRLNKDKCWTYVHDKPDLVDEVLHFGSSRYYAVNYWNELYSCDVSHHITTQSYADVNCIASGMSRQGDFDRRRYIVDSNDKELIMVKRYVTYKYDREGCNTVFSKLSWMVHWSGLSKKALVMLLYL